MIGIMPGPIQPTVDFAGVAVPVDVVEKEQEEAPRQGSLKLSNERLEWLVQRAEVRINECMREQGRNIDGTVDPMSWMAERLRNRDSYANDWAWRASMPGTVFKDSNLTWGDNGRRVRLLSARLRDELMGTQPFFGCMTTRNGDAKLTKAVESYVQDRVGNSNVPDTITDGIRTALVENEVVIKTTYVVKRSKFVGPARGVFVGPDGEPLRTSKGDLIYEKDDVFPDPDVEGLVRLNKDPSFAFVAGQYESDDFEELEQEETDYEGAESVAIDTRDFLCPLKVDDIHNADINVHLYETTPEDVGYSYAEMESAKSYFSWYQAATTGAKQPIYIRGEQQEESSAYLPRILVAEVYIKCDADEDGSAEEILLVLDLLNHKAIFHDYLKNHCKRRPFAVLTGVEKVAGRWYGIGVYSKMAFQEMYCDAQLNRINQKDSRSASATFYFRNAVTQWKNGIKPTLGTDDLWEISDQWDPSKPPIFRTNLLENADLGMELCQQMRQAADTAFGIQSGQSASAMKLNQSRTATGVMSIEKDADIISKDTKLAMSKGIEKVLEQAVEMELSNMDEQVVAFTPDGQELVTLDRDEIRSLDRKVKLLLTKSRGSEMLQTSQAAEAVAMRYLRLSPFEQHYIRSLMLSELKALEVDNAADILPEVTQEDLEAWKKAQAEAKEPPKPPSRSIATKFGELARSEQRQLLMSEGIQPADDAEIEQDDMRDLQMERAEGAPYPGEIQARQTQPTPNS